ncbi:GGDEF domain-containing protein [Pseudonocardiaceae bacterium YIM PH 21723]|nr:GGDEF domain-containing protein [Pseudonocardiaceae bacterium YIM PH 21723]
MISNPPPHDEAVHRLLKAGRLTEANQLFDRIIAKPVETGVSRWRHTALILNRGFMAWRLGRIPLAMQLSAEGWLDIDSREEPHGPDAAAALGLLTAQLATLGQTDKALEAARSSWRTAYRCGDQLQMELATQRMGAGLILTAIESPPDQAKALYIEATEILAQGTVIADFESFVYAPIIATYARALAGAGDLFEAEAQARRAMDLGLERDDQWTISVCHAVHAAVRRAEGALPEARSAAMRALAGAQRINDQHLIGRFGLDLMEICVQAGDPVGEVHALRAVSNAERMAIQTLQEGLGQALEDRRITVHAARSTLAAYEAAHRDPLTDLANRRGLEASDVPAQPWLVLVDVDEFKAINDSAGHPAGDMALREIAMLLRRECAAEDVISRWAGDEFVLLVSGVDRPEAGSEIAERIRAAVSAHRWPAGLCPTVSIGVATGGSTMDELFLAADQALYQAKSAGRNRVEVSRS